MIPTPIANVPAKYGFNPTQWDSLPWKERRLLILAYECDVRQVKEEPKGSNRGKDVEKYLNSVGLDGGFAWCAAFVNWGTLMAGNSERPKSPSMAASWLKFKPKSLLTIQRGDLGGWINKDGTGHVFPITKVVRKFGIPVEVHTLEGNSNDEGSREGFEVCRRIRSVKGLRFAA